MGYGLGMGSPETAREPVFGSAVRSVGRFRDISAIAESSFARALHGWYPFPFPLLFLPLSLTAKSADVRAAEQPTTNNDDGDGAFSSLPASLCSGVVRPGRRKEPEIELLRV